MNENLKRIFGQVLDVPADQVDPSFSMKTSGGKWDSVAHINLMLAIEQEFNTFFSPEELVDMTSYEKIIATLTSKGLVGQSAGA